MADYIVYRKVEDAVIMLLKDVSARARNAREKLNRRIDAGMM